MDQREVGNGIVMIVVSGQHHRVTELTKFLIVGRVIIVGDVSAQ